MYILIKIEKFFYLSLVIMLVLVVDIMWKSLLLCKLELLYKDNLIKCDTFLKNKKNFLFDGVSNF